MNPNIDLNPSLAWSLEALRRGDISPEKARRFIEDWPAYQPGELAQKSAALEALAEVELERLRVKLRQRRGEPAA